jgi:hypothetical protein
MSKPANNSQTLFKRKNKINERAGVMKMAISAILFLIFVTQCSTKEKKNIQWSDNVQVVLDNTTPLKYDRGNRLPLYLWPAIDPGDLNDEDAEKLVKEFDTRGVGIVCSWSSKNIEKTMTRCLTVARAQKKLGQRVNIDATDLLDSFFNGDVHTAHTDEEGNPFFDSSFGDHKMGCPFSIDFRKKEIREGIELFTGKYKDEGLPVDFIFTDWEIDGPLEVNRAYEASKKCVRCRKYLGDDFSYPEFQKTMREMRSYLQNYSYSTPVLLKFPEALVGNYAVYPNDGYRYWYDYFEYYVDGQPYKADQRAKYRQWYNDFPATGFTFAMPVVYTWDPIYSWYDFENSDYRWFYNMLLVASNAGKSTPHNIPIISFVHWNTIYVSENPDSTVKQMSKESYQELLWHMLLRGTDTFFMWSGKKEYPEEVRLLHEVYSAAQQYGKFLDNGYPVTFDVPNKPGTVISGLALGDSVLIRRTDFGNNHDPVEVLVGTKIIKVGYAPGTCTILSLEKN